MTHLKDPPDASNHPESHHRNALFLERFTAHVRQSPESLAAVDIANGQTLTYDQLDHRATELAHRLRHHGVLRQQPVGVSLERSLDLAVALIAIQKLSAIYVPLDPTYPPQRLEAMVEDAGIRVLVTCPAECSVTRDGLSVIESTVIESTAIESTVAAPCAQCRSTGPLQQSPRASDIAYIIYTSGSTGRPKGVEIEHRAVAWYLDAAQAGYGLTPTDRFLALSSISFDMSICELLPPLALGATVAFHPGRVTRLEELMDRCRDFGVSVMFLPTAFWHELAHALDADPKLLPETLRVTSFGGERVSPAAIAAWRRAVGPRVTLFNGYGPTEATVEVTLNPLTDTRESPEDAARSIGFPMAGTQLAVVDPSLHPVDTGTVGELCIAGPGLARGYRQRPAITAERFVPNPWASEPGARLYRTGDRVSCQHDGRLQIFGRLDQQVKIRGFRVEPGEVEAILTGHPRVSTAAVVVPEEAGDRWLAAFVTAADGTTADGTTTDGTTVDGTLGILGVGRQAPASPNDLEKDLRAHLRTLVPNHMVPADIRVLERLPVAAGGKVDRRALEHQALERQALGRRGRSQGISDRSRANRRPQAAIGEGPEAVLADVWQHVLRIDAVGPQESFFELGGDSILAIRIATEARRRGLLLDPQDLFDHPTLGGLAPHIRPIESHGQDPRDLPRPTPLGDLAPDDAPSPLTPVQRWFFEDTRFEEPWHFNQSMLLQVRRHLDFGRLQRAFEILLQHHDGLRMAFTDGAPDDRRQRYRAQEEHRVVLHVDLSALPVERRPEARFRAATRAQSSFDLCTGPLVRAVLFELGAGAQQLLIAIHHLVVDGVSWSIVLGDLEELDTRLARGEPAPDLGAKGTSYATWARLQTERTTHPILLDQLEYWQGRPPRIPPLPIDFAVDRHLDNTSSSSDRVSMALDARETELLLRQAPAAYRTRINDFLLAAAVASARRWTGETHLLIDLEGHGREAIFPGVDVSRTTGWFTSTFPVHLQLPEDPEDLGAVLESIKEQLRAIPEHGIGFGQLYYLAAPDIRAKLRELPTPEVSFNYLGQLDALFAQSKLFSPSGEPRGMERGPRGLRPYLLEIDGGVVGGRLWMNWKFSRRLHARETMERLAQDFRRELLRLVDHCLRDGVGGPTPSDVPLSGLDSAALGRLLGPQRPQVEDVYPLAPLQEGILFHVLLDRHTAFYCEQNSWQLTGDLDPAVWREAWGELLARHAILRTAFAWQNLQRPLQIVHRRAELPWTEVDWRHQGLGPRSPQVAELMDRERRRGFDLAQPPLTRFALVRLGARRWRFIWTVHHLLLDGWSLSTLFEEVFQIYRSLQAGRPPESVRTRPFKDYIAWLDGLDRSAAEAFFREYLHALDPAEPLALGPVSINTVSIDTVSIDTTAPSTTTPDDPADSDSVTPLGDRRRECRRVLSSTLSQRLDTVGKRRGLTLNTLIQGAWALWLARVGQRHDVVFGATVAARPTELEGVDSIMGLLINTLPVRVSVTFAGALWPWLESLQKINVALRRFEHTPLVDIRRWSPLPSEAPLFETILGFQNYPSHLAFQERHGALRAEDPWSASEINYPLALVALPGPQTTLQLSYDPTRFSHSAMGRTLHQLEGLLTAFADDRPTSLDELRWWTRAERHQLLWEWGIGERRALSVARQPVTQQSVTQQPVARHPVSQQSVTHPGDTSFPAIVARIARSSPELPALVFVRRAADTQFSIHDKLTYGALADATARLAERLERHGVGPEVRVALMLHRSPEMIIALLAVLSAGGAYVPVDPTLPDSRKTHILDDSEASLLLTHNELAADLAVGGPKVLTIDPMEGHPPRRLRPLQPAWVDPDQAAYVLYTSGSTGLPKGVVIPHRGLAHLARDNAFGGAPGRNILQLASLGFDASIWEITSALAHGATLHLPRRGPTPAGHDLAALLQQRRIHAALIPPSSLAAIPSRMAEDLPELRILVVGGEACPLALARLWAKGRQLINAYGPTEATVCATVQHGLWQGRLPIGGPLGLARLRIVAADGTLAIMGTAGELWIGGPALGRGYHGRPALTAERFVPDPFGTDPGERLYRTGDRVQYLHEGRLDYLGRLDLQVKIRGVRIELQGIEAVLETLPGVRGAVVLCEGALGDPDRRLVAHVVAETLPADWRHRLLERLPAVMVPSRLVSHRAFPTNASGKVDRRALAGPPPGQAPADAETTSAETTGAEMTGDPTVSDGKTARTPGAPQDPWETMLQTIWGEVLGVPRVGRHDDFFELGGHSLLATQVVSRIQHELDAEIPLRMLFEHPTVMELSRAVASTRRPRQPPPTLGPVSRSRPLPLSFAQQRLWFIDQLDPDNPSYNMPATFDLEGPLDIPALDAAVGALIARHEVLRTRFPTRAGQPRQEILDPPRGVSHLPRVDLRQLPPDIAQRTARALAHRDAERPFPLASGPLMRVLLVLGTGLGPRPADHVLLLDLHHIISDGWSQGVLFRELSEYYRGYRRRTPFAMPPLPVQYADFAVWQRQWLRNKTLDALLRHWRKRLEGAETLELPTDRQRSSERTGRGAYLELHLGADETLALRSLGRTRGASTYMVLLAVFGVLLGRLSGQRDIVIGSPIANRNHPELEGLIGFFVNALVMRLSLDRSNPSSALVDHVRDIALEAFDHQDVPFEHLVEILRPERDADRNPIFQVSFGLQNAPAEPLALDGLTVRAVEPDHPRIRFDLEVHLWEVGDTLQGFFGYDTDLFDATTAQRWLGAFLTLARAMGSRPQSPVEALPWLSPGQRHQVLYAWRDHPWAWKGDPLPSDLDPWQRVQHWAKIRPSAPAVELDTGQGSPQTLHTYAHLVRTVDTLVDRLRLAGVDHGTVVGVGLERSPATLASLLAVLAIGGVYVPLDPKLPRRRLLELTHDASVEFLVLAEDQAPGVFPETLPSLHIHGRNGQTADKSNRPSRLIPRLHAESLDTPAGRSKRAESLAYILFTSGTSGAPKGVMVGRRSLGLHLAAVVERYGLGRQDRYPWFAAPTFDVSIEQMMAPLMAGATLIVTPPEPFDPQEFPQTLRRLRPTVINLPPALWQPAMDAITDGAHSAADTTSTLRQLIVGGEMLPRATLDRWRRSPWGQVPVLNAYGPTEAVITALVQTLGDSEGAPPVGRPVGGRRAHILDPEGAPLPGGVAGELWIGGEALAVGYMGAARLTARRFRPDPWARTPGRRLYRTGDRARFLADGTVQILGRMDRQLKLRGMRLEPGEIENVLLRHETLRGAVVDTVRAEPRESRQKSVGGPDSQRLVAWVVPDPGVLLGSWKTRHIDEWRSLYEDLHEHMGGSSSDVSDTEGWTSSYTGRPIPADDMRDWLDQTVTRIHALEPRRLLEIGCGAGLLTLPLAPLCHEILGTDFSKPALERLRQRLATDGIEHVRVLERRADDHAGISKGTYDTVVLNSVVQYFPNLDYLLEVLDGAVQCLTAGGTIYLGDIRSLALLDLFYTTVEHHLAGHPLPKSDLSRRLARRRQQENELIIDPTFFLVLGQRLPGVRSIHVQPKDDRLSNELVRFRYDAVLHLGEATAPETGPPEGSIDWYAEDLDATALEDLLGQEPERLVITGIPLDDAISATELRDLLRRFPYHLGFEWRAGESPSGPSSLDLHLRRHPAASLWPGVPSGSPTESQPWATNPLWLSATRQLIPKLRTHLEDQLPTALIPSVFVLLDALPRTSRGKIDYRALPMPEVLRPQANNQFIAPRTTTEGALGQRWIDLLGLDEVGLHDHFFHLGGHSLLATQLTSWIRRHFGVEISLRTLFEKPTLGALAKAIDRLRHRQSPHHGQTISPTLRRGPLPLSHAQHSLWFLDQLRPGNPAYHLSTAFELHGALDVEALDAALHRIIRRHEILRTIFPHRDGTPEQRILETPRMPLASVDLRPVPELRRRRVLDRALSSAIFEPFDLARGPLMRAVLLKLRDREHCLLFVQHHIVSDGWSLGILGRELTALYAASTRGQPSPLDPPSIQYADYAAWQRRRTRGRRLAAHLDWWRQRLAGAPPQLRLPTDRPRPKRAPAQVSGGAVPVTLGSSLTASLGELAVDLGASLYMTLLSAFAMLLHRHGGQQDLVIGSPVAHRNRSELEELIGFFVNTLPIRLGVRPQTSYRQLLGETRDIVLGAFAHQDLPFDKLVEALSPIRDPSRNPLFQVTFALQNTGAHEVHLSGLEAHEVELPLEHVLFDLELHLWPQGGGLQGFFAYRNDLFDTTTIQRFGHHFVHLLGAAIQAPDRDLSNLPMMSRGERHQLLVAWGMPSGESGAGATHLDIPREITRQAMVRGESLAVDLALARTTTSSAEAARLLRGALTYRDLDRSSRAVAKRLRALGVGPEVVVGLFLDRSPGRVVAALAVLAAGGAYLPMATEDPSARLAMMLQDSKAHMILTSGELIDRLPRGVPALMLESLVRIEEIIRPEKKPPSPHKLSGAPESSAYVLYTSGSTGRPKGVVVSRRALGRHLQAMQDKVRLDPSDRVLQKTAFTFDPSAWEHWATLTQGGRLLLSKPKGQRDIPHLATTIRRARITALRTSPALLRALLGHSDFRRAEALRLILCGGEALSEDLFRRFAAEGPRARLINVYGPTETTINTSLQPLERSPDGEPVTLGRPLGRATLFVVDPQLRPVPLGTVGELVIGGPTLARGYLNFPARTAAKFVPDPFARTAGQRLYRTGDRARYSKDGRLFFCGRMDLQIKLRGFRIEPQEIERLLLEHPTIAEAAVVVQPRLAEEDPAEDPSSRGPSQDSDDHLLVAYVVPKTNSPVDTWNDTAPWQDFLRQRLPYYMVPSVFRPCSELPQNAVGKVDRASLARTALPSSRNVWTRGQTPPRNPRQEILAAIWCQVLGIDRVGIHESFFDLGGHSLLATQVVSRIRRVLGIELPLETLFEKPTIAGLSLAIEKPFTGETHLSLAPVSRQGSLPLSFAQQRLWFLAQLQPEDASYNMPLAFELQGPLDPEALSAAWWEILRRHEVLRTTFPHAAGQPHQRILDPPAMALAWIDCRALSASQRERLWRTVSQRESERSFDLTRGPLCRAMLLLLEPQRHVLLIELHHSIADGWSKGVILRELAALYPAAVEGRPSPLPELAIQYADFAVWQRRWLDHKTTHRLLQWWRTQLEGAKEISLPTDRPRPTVRSSRGALVELCIPADTTQRLLALAQRANASLYMTLLTAFMAFIHRLTGQTDILVGSPIANRNRQEIEDLIGFFINSLVLRGQPTSDLPFDRFQQQIRDFALGAYDHQDLPFERLVEALHPQRDLSRNPLFQATFALRYSDGAPPSFGNTSVRELTLECRHVQFDLDIDLWQVTDGIRGTLSYSRDLFDRTTLMRWSRAWTILLEGLAGTPSAPIGHLPLLGTAERHQLLAEWSSVESSKTVSTADNPSVHHTILAWAEATPDALAVVFPGKSDETRTLTYGQLAHRAGRLATLLHRHGLDAETRVGLFVDRSPEAIVGALGILWAGAAYVPLDPNYPRQRLAFVVEDSALELVVTTESKAKALPFEVPTVVTLPEDGALGEAWDKEQTTPPTEVTAEHLAYVVYTSGSTGRPKGVMVSHGAWLTSFRAWSEAYRLDRLRCHLQAASMSFDVFAGDLIRALGSGATLAICPQTTLLDPAGLYAFLNQYRVDAGEMVPAIARQLMSHVEDLGEHLAFLKLLALGSDTAYPEDFRRLAALCPADTRLINSYGLSEAAIDSTWFEARPSHTPTRSMPVGRPFPGSRILVLDRHGYPVPIGAIGELCVAGPLARGYVSNPTLTARRFVPNPHGLRAGERLYRSGDLVRLASDGHVELLGRADQQIKIRGLRVEPGEVEAQLNALPTVQEAVVAAHTFGTSGSPRLIAWIVPRPGDSAKGFSVRSLRESLRQQIPEAMIPSVIALLDSMPRTPNGKIDRRALGQATPNRAALGRTAPGREALAAVGLDTTEDLQPPQTPNEQLVAHIWSRTLGIETLDVRDDFFALGGHSLVAVRVVMDMAEQSGVEMTLRDLFERPVLLELASLIDDRQRRGPQP